MKDEGMSKCVKFSRKKDSRYQRDLREKKR